MMNAPSGSKKGSRKGGDLVGGAAASRSRKPRQVTVALAGTTVELIPGQRRDDDVRADRIHASRRCPRHTASARTRRTLTRLEH